MENEPHLSSVFSITLFKGNMFSDQGRVILLECSLHISALVTLWKYYLWIEAFYSYFPVLCILFSIFTELHISNNCPPYAFVVSFLDLFINRVWMFCLCAYMCTMCVPSTLRSQNGTSDPLELELMMTVSHHKHRSSARITSDLNCWAMSPDPWLGFLRQGLM